MQTSLITSTATQVVLINGAKANNIFWAAQSAVTLGYSSSLYGNILAGTSVTFGSDSVIVGRALAAAAVSFESGSSVTLP